MVDKHFALSQSSHWQFNNESPLTDWEKKSELQTFDDKDATFSTLSKLVYRQLDDLCPFQDGDIDSVNLTGASYLMEFWIQQSRLL